MKLKKIKNIRFKIFNLLFMIVTVFFISNHSLSENFFDEAKQKFDKKIMKTPNFYFKEILFIIQKMQNLIYI